MVVVAQGVLPAPGKQYKVYLNEDRVKQKWYLRVTHTYDNNNKHFRAGTYETKEDALNALRDLDPVYPKKGRSKRGTVDQYGNGMWRVRVKHRGEHMHVGYYKSKTEAEKRLKEALNDHNYLEERYQSLLTKRKRKRQKCKTEPEVKRQRQQGSQQQQLHMEVLSNQTLANPLMYHLSGSNVHMNQIYQDHTFRTQAQVARQNQEMNQQWNSWQSQIFGKPPQRTNQNVGIGIDKVKGKKEESEEILAWCDDPVLEKSPEPLQFETDLTAIYFPAQQPNY